MTSEEIEDWLLTQIANELRISRDDIDSRTPFAELGIGSLAGAALAGDLEEVLGQDLPVTLLWDHPTIERLARFLGETAEGAPAKDRTA